MQRNRWGEFLKYSFRMAADLSCNYKVYMQLRELNSVEPDEMAAFRLEIRAIRGCDFRAMRNALRWIGQAD